MSETAIDTLSCSELPDESWKPAKTAHRPHWNRPIRKCVYTLNVSPDGKGSYEPEICELTYPLMRAYAEKIGAEFHIITERKFPEWPVVYEKLQIHALGQGGLHNHVFPHGVSPEWNIYIDSDALVSPEMFDVTEHIDKDTVCHNGRDMAGIRWKYDQYFRRDGRNIGSCNWFTVASDWCLDLWRPLDDLTPEQAFENINLTIQEHNSGFCQTEHLIDDYTLSRNIARFGLKFKTVTDICGELMWKTPDGRPYSPFLYHLYNISREEKIQRLLQVLATPNGQVIADPRNPNAPPLGIGWGLMLPEKADELRKKWGIR